MSHAIHPNQFPVMFAERNEEEDVGLDARRLSQSLRFLEKVDYDDEALRLLRRRRTQRTAGSIAGITAPRASFIR